MWGWNLYIGAEISVAFRRISSIVYFLQGSRGGEAPKQYLASLFSSREQAMTRILRPFCGAVKRRSFRNRPTLTVCLRKHFSISLYVEHLAVKT